MEFLIVFLFAVAVSADGFVVGLAYGVRNIKIPFASLIVIAMASALAVTISMLFGMGIASLLSPQVAASVGAVILIIMGIYFLFQGVKDRINSLDEDEQKLLLEFNIKPLGIIVHILKEPSTADFDDSGVISAKEAFFLGVALALDAFGAGIGAAMTGFNVILTATCVGILKFLLVNGGLFLGKLMINEKIKIVSSILPGLILIILGIIGLN
ncbi:hypothetical protein SYNTR_1585 [Candidatus Syntrophocurvum alkaliphilum]|uniref:Sporulation membrane protein YtaF n=1 Tax=Candidatus Syntrophocurvum alkaliphilum TaxID=2293317 RepID=A0A6I6DBV8_9FIRM|nr:sporulation membrane protein YtaF [Candidatus Syntrophocurvum alkaliphilum]QGU00179.1 hypothetical protein SYNTR_1585 [Candidatus Syntrophocurvum alkaliphilum]